MSSRDNPPSSPDSTSQPSTQPPLHSASSAHLGLVCKRTCRRVNPNSQSSGNQQTCARTVAPGSGVEKLVFGLHFPHTLVDLRLLGQGLNFARCQLQHAALAGARCLLLPYNEQLLLGESLLLANFLQNLDRSVSAVCRPREDSTHFLQRFVWHRHCEGDTRIWMFWW
jgi:hypothetical protein